MDKKLRPTRKQSRYWDKILTKEKLGKYRGEPGKTKYGEERITLEGSSQDLLRKENEFFDRKAGKIKKLGHGPD